MRCPICHHENAGPATTCRSCGSPFALGSQAPSSSISLQAGTRLNGGRFTVGKVLGQGGFGVTYLGGDTTLDRPVAIKEFFPQGCIRQGTTVRPSGALTTAEYQAARQKFLDEARVLAKFHHRGIVAVYSTFEENNTAYMVMEFVRGSTLLSLVEARGPLPEEEVVSYMAQVADALSVVHQAGLLHRDVKPENLMVTQEGRVVLVDFGTARAFTSGKTRRMTATLTPGYAPLEQYGQHARFGVFTDLYALGATCYHLLTGEMPVPATDRAAGVELRPPHVLSSNISRTVSDAVMWAMQMRAEARPQSAHDFLQALRGGRVHADAVDRGQDTQTPSVDRDEQNPYEARMKQLVAELQKPSAPPPSRHQARIEEIRRQLALCAGHSLPAPNYCPGCGANALEEITGRYTGECPICRSGRLMRRKLDLDRCPVCRQGQLANRDLDQPLLFCPVCRASPLREERRKRLGLRIDLWWICPHCKAEFDVADLDRKWVKLERYLQDPFGVGAQYGGQKLEIRVWLSLSRQCRRIRTCTACHAAFYEFPDASMMLGQYSTDPYGIGSKMLRQCLPRLDWFRLAHTEVGNVRCSQCQAEFDFLQGAATLKLLICKAQQFAWADSLKGQTLPITTWYLRSAGKRSDRPGWLCKHCATEFDTEQDGLQLVHSTAAGISQYRGFVLSRTDWHRLSVGIPTTAQETALRKELADLEEIAQQEEADFRSRDKARRQLQHAELQDLVKQSTLGGFLPLATGGQRLPLESGEVLCWSSPAIKLKQRRQRGKPYWLVDGDGTIMVTNQRIVFAQEDGCRWQKPVSKVHTVRVENLGTETDKAALILGFDGLQNPIGFYCSSLRASFTIHGYPCSVTLTLTDLAKAIDAYARAMA